MSAQPVDSGEKSNPYITLVERAQSAEGTERDQAFNALMEQFSFAAQSWAYQTLGDVHAAQDAAQEAFITAYEKLDDLRDPAAFPSWLRMIVRTQVGRLLRDQRDAIPLEDETALAADDLAQDAEQRLLHEGVRRAVRALPEHERVVTELFYIGGYSQQEIAERLALPLTTVKKRLQYARERLRETMAPVSLMRLYSLRAA